MKQEFAIFTLIDLYRGRINQREFLFLGMIMFVLNLVVNNIGMRILISLAPVLAPTMMTIIQIILTIFTMHLYVRRLHDIGQTGWFALLIILLTWINILLGVFCFIVLVVISSAPSENQYGPMPWRERSLRDVFFNT